MWNPITFFRGDGLRARLAALLDFSGAVLRMAARHCQSKIYTVCSRIKADWSSTVFAHELTTRSAGFDAENRLYLFALTMPPPADDRQRFDGHNQDSHTAIAPA